MTDRADEIADKKEDDRYYFSDWTINQAVRADEVNNLEDLMSYLGIHGYQIVKEETSDSSDLKWGEKPVAGEGEVVLDYSVAGKETDEDGWRKVKETGSLILDRHNFELELRRLEEHWGFDFEKGKIRELFEEKGEEVVTDVAAEEVSEVRIQVR